MTELSMKSPAGSRGAGYPGLILLAIGFVIALGEAVGLHAFGLPVSLMVTVAVLATVGGALYLLLTDDVSLPATRAFALLGAGLVCLLVGSYFGLFVAPPEQYMGNVQRIMYIHVPCAWNWMLAIIFAFVSAIAFLFTSDMKWDARMDAGLEVASVLAFLLCMQGSIWAKPTWGVWWDWDPRLTSVAVLLFAFLGIIALRKFVDNPARRAIWSAVATIIASVDLPIVYFSVKWWNSLHQQQSSPATVSRAFYIPLRVNAFAILFITAGFLILRARLAQVRLAQEIAPPPMMSAEEAGELA